MISVLIPFRGDGGQRDRLWAHCKTLWEQLDVELIVGTESGVGPFNIAQAFNDAASRATGDKIIVYGADHLPDWDRIQWANEQLETRPWVALYAHTAAYSEQATNEILAGHQPTTDFYQWAPFCTAIIGVRRDAWIPFDERFTGWGSEDRAWRTALTALYGPTPEPTGTLRTLWHPQAPKTHAGTNYELYNEYVDAANEGRMREYLTEHIFEQTLTARTKSP